MKTIAFLRFLLAIVDFLLDANLKFIFSEHIDHHDQQDDNGNRRFPHHFSSLSQFQKERNEEDLTDGVYRLVEESRRMKKKKNDNDLYRWFISKTEFFLYNEEERFLEISFTRLLIFHLKIIENIFFASNRQGFTVNTSGSNLLDGIFVQFVALFLSDETHVTVQLIVTGEIQKSTIVLITGKDANEQNEE